MMSILLSLLLAQARVLPEIDRRALELQARAEALQSRRPSAPVQAQQRTARAPAAPVQAQRPATPAPAPQIQRTAVRTASVPARPSERLPTLRRASGGALDLSAITTICRAAGNQADPVAFLATLSRSYSLNGAESSSLRTSCAAYLAGRADARTSSYGAPAH
jgi:hypothetical protein